MPLFILSFAVPFLFAVFGRLSAYLVFLSVFNAGGACVDVLNVILILSQVPKDGVLIANGYATFYETQEESLIRLFPPGFRLFYHF